MQAIRETGNWESWIKFFLTGVAEVANEATDTSRKIVQMREAHRNNLIEELGKGAANGLKLLESLYRRPIFTVSSVSDLLGVSPQAANNLTEKFDKLGLINEITGQKRNRVFRYDPYVSLFSD